MPQVYFRAVKAPRLMAGATVVTAVIGDFTGSFTSLASSFADNFIIPSSPQPLGGGAERRWGSKLLVGEQAGRTSPKPRLRAGQALGWDAAGGTGTCRGLGCCSDTEQLVAARTHLRH